MACGLWSHQIQRQIRIFQLGFPVSIYLAFDRIRSSSPLRPIGVRAFSSYPSDDLSLAVEEIICPASSSARGYDLGSDRKSLGRLPILRQYASNAGYVVRVLATSPEQISRQELRRWIKKQSFDQSQLDVFVRSAQQPDWNKAIAIVNEAFGPHQTWTEHLPSSVLAELAIKKIGNQDQLDDLLDVLGHRISTEDDILIVSQLINAALQAAVSIGNLVVAGDLVDYSIRYSTEIARVEIDKQFLPTPGCPTIHHPASGTRPRQDPSLALRPLISSIAALMSQRALHSRTPTYRLLGQLIRATIHLCDGLHSVFSRISKQNTHLLCRAMLTAALSPDGYPLTSNDLDLILKQNLPVSTMRLAMIAMIHYGERNRATAIGKLLQSKTKSSELQNTKYEIDLLFQGVRESKDHAYSSSEKLHRQILGHLLSSHRSTGGSIEPYTQYMSALFRHHLPKLALEVWEKANGLHLAPDAAAIQVAMSIYMDLNRPSAAIQLFNQYSKPQDQTSSHRPPQFGTSIGPNLQLISTYARALDMAGYPTAVYDLWKNITMQWAIQPDGRIFGALISSARKLALAHPPGLANAMLLPDHPGSLSEESITEDDWDGEPAAEFAMRLFWSILYQNWPTLAQNMRIPIQIGSQRNKPFSIHHSFLERIRNLASNPFAARLNQLTRRSYLQDMARTVIPSLGRQTIWSSIIPNRYTFRDMIELLGTSDQADLIPLLLSWMEALHIKPDQDFLVRAYYWIYRVGCPPIQNRIRSLDEFVERWIEKESLKDTIKIPTEEMMENHYHERFKWAHGYFNRLSS